MTIVLFVFIFSLLVLVHEFGHYVSAVLSGIRVEEFAIGFPPRLWSKTTRRGTVISLNAIPIGGFVRLEGEDHPGGKNAFTSQSILRRSFVIVSGVVMNVLLAFVLLTGVLVLGAPMVESDLPPSAVVSDQYIEIVNVLADTPAARAGVQPAERIIAVGGQSITSIEQLQGIVTEHVGTALDFTLASASGQRSLTITPTTIRNQVGIGVELLPMVTVRLPIHTAVVQAAAITGRQLWAITNGLVGLMMDLMRGNNVSEHIVGPVGITKFVGVAATSGWFAVINLMILLSLNLAVVNILPIPALDGGRLFFLLLSALFTVPTRIERKIHQFGFIALLALLALITVNDLRAYLP
ncbi:site-2 protease family protein [Candidatus Uhrbacteria bacterium]|nr:site-2 protease family protein [Candidatus Uhrbacteria bacterium]